MNLSDINTVRSLLAKNGFTFKKSLGQNFLTDPEVCPAMARAACDENTGVLEIGPGFGVLTAELSKAAKRVVAIELDERLKKVLPETLADCKNVEVIYGDALKLDLKALIKEHFADCERVAVCANLPYYITSPVIMTLLESRLPIDTVTVMVQKEAAERLCAEVGTREAGAVSVAVSYYSKPEILFGVDKESFMPPPKVDSAVIKLKILEKPPVKVNDERAFFRLVKCCFAQRRKTAVNSISNTLHMPKQQVTDAFEQAGVRANSRAEALTLPEFAAVVNQLTD